PTVTLSRVTIPDSCAPTRTSAPVRKRTMPVAVTVASMLRLSARTSVGGGGSAAGLERPRRHHPPAAATPAAPTISSHFFKHKPLTYGRRPSPSPDFGRAGSP